MDPSQLLIRLKRFVRSSESPPTSEAPIKEPLQVRKPAFVSGSQVKQFYENTVGKKALERCKKVQSKEVQAVKPKTKQRKSVRLKKSPFNVNNFMKAVESGCITEVEGMLEQNKDAVNCRDQFGWTALMCACRAGNLAMVQLLLQRGADVSVRDKGGISCHKLAESTGHLTVLELLNEFQQSPNVTMKPLVSESEQFSPFFCDVCNQQIENSSYKKHLLSTIHNFHMTSKRRMPTMYGIPGSNRGFQILVKSGWNKEVGLGPSGEGHKFPPKTILKQDRTGLGAKRYKPRVTHWIEDIKEERKPKRSKTNIKSVKQNEQRLERNLRRMLT